MGTGHLGYLGMFVYLTFSSNRELVLLLVLVLVVLTPNVSCRSECLNTAS